MYGIIGLILLALWIYTIFVIVTSSAQTNTKILWVIIVLILGPIGVLLYFLIGKSQP
jgi:hypothetical protein